MKRVFKRKPLYFDDKHCTRKSKEITCSTEVDNDFLKKHLVLFMCVCVCVCVCVWCLHVLSKFTSLIV